MSDFVSKFALRLDLHQSPYHAGVMQKIGWQVDGIPGSQIYYRPLGPFSVAKYQRAKIVDDDRLTHFRRTHKTLTTYIEPSLNTVYDKGVSVEPFAHSTTSLINLSQSEKNLLGSFTQKTRYNINHSLKAGKVFISSTPLPKLSAEQKNTFFTLHSEWSKRKNVIGYSRELLDAIITSFAIDSTLHLAYDQQNNPLGALLILSFDSVSTYYAAFSTEEGYALYAPTLLTWQALITAKDIGCDIFDFGGTYDPRYPKMYKKWQGFTKFKAGFNPTTIQYPPTKLHIFW